MSKYEDFMPDADRIASMRARGVLCGYCSWGNLVETITDRLFACCNHCAKRDNEDKILLKTVPCICCGKQLKQSMEDEELISFRSIERQPFSGGMAGTISAGYGSTHDTKVYMIAVCDDCITDKMSESKLIYVYTYMP